MDEVFVEVSDDPVDEEWVEQVQAEMDECLRLVNTGEIKVTFPDECVMGARICDWPNCKCDEVNCSD